MQVIKRMTLRIAALILISGAIFGILVQSGNITLGAQVDAVTKATGEIVYAEDIDGSFVVLINKDQHPNTEVLAQWEIFFSGGEVGVIFEDIVCYVSTSDPSGFEVAESFQSRLPENQLVIKTVPSTMLVDKAGHGVFDVLVLSEPVAQSLGVERLYDEENIEVIRL